MWSCSKILVVPSKSNKNDVFFLFFCFQIVGGFEGEIALPTELSTLTHASHAELPHMRTHTSSPPTTTPVCPPPPPPPPRCPHGVLSAGAQVPKRTALSSRHRASESEFLRSRFSAWRALEDTASNRPSNTGVCLPSAHGDLEEI